MFFDKLLENVNNADDVNQAEVLDRIHQKLEITKATLANNHTAKLWIQFMDMIDLLHTFIKAERTGNWQLSSPNFVCYASPVCFSRSQFVYKVCICLLPIDE